MRPSQAVLSTRKNEELVKALAVKARDCEFPVKSPQCDTCWHLIESMGPKTCAAYPEGIPQDIFKGEIEHSRPLPGDNGIQYMHFSLGEGERPLHAAVRARRDRVNEWRKSRGLEELPPFTFPE